MTIEDKKQEIIKLFLESENWNMHIPYFSYINYVHMDESWQDHYFWALVSKKLTGGFKIDIRSSWRESLSLINCDIKKEEYELIKIVVKNRRESEKTEKELREARLEIELINKLYDALKKASSTK